MHTLFLNMLFTAVLNWLRLASEEMEMYTFILLFSANIWDLYEVTPVWVFLKWIMNK